MHCDVTLITHASRPVSRPLLPDVWELRDHLEAREPRVLRLRRSLSSGLVRLAERVDSRPVNTERDALFEAISALLAEPKCEAPPREMVSQRGC